MSGAYTAGKKQFANDKSFKYSWAKTKGFGPCGLGGIRMKVDYATSGNMNADERIRVTCEV